MFHPTKYLQQCLTALERSTSELAPCQAARLGSQPGYPSWFLLCLLFLWTCHPQAGGKLGQYLWLMTSWEHMDCKVPLLGSYIIGALGESNETSKSSNLRQYPCLLVGGNPVYIGGKQWLAFPAQGYFCWAYSTSCRCHDELLRVPPPVIFQIRCWVAAGHQLPLKLIILTVSASVRITGASGTPNLLLVVTAIEWRQNWLYFPEKN